MRLFAAIRPPGLVLEHLSGALAAVLAPRADRSSPLQPRANWHVTLAFYGEAPAGAVPSIEADLRAELASVSPFELELRGAGTFRGRVGWIGVGGDLASFATAARAALAAYPTGGDRSANPHLTVTRAADRPAVADALRALSIYVGPTWQAGEVELIRSDLGQGPGRHALYTTLGRWPLGG
ncbi:MAG: RNA 2',3'-cyclic phosphodiesterase [Bifidobacteriaceae bacterium]|nr:RNA 2',3'-cyclic phosphodiesterase [Bifidobacteriaceae bacterium]